MDYEKKYKEALERAKKFIEANPLVQNLNTWIKETFPELVESEDERIRKLLVEAVTQVLQDQYCSNRGVSKEKVVAWIEKQGERKTPRWMIDFLDNYRRNIGCSLDYDEAKDVDSKILCIKEWLENQGEQKSQRMISAEAKEAIYDKPTDKAKPKFKVGDWITNGDYTWKIVEVKPLDYILQSQNGNIVDDTIYHVDNQFNFWTIQDAKDGDVLASNRSIFIFSQEYMAEKLEAHCGIMNGFLIAKPEGCWTNEKCYPATKGQRDFLFKKMKEAGYERSDKDRKLIKIVK